MDEKELYLQQLGSSIQFLEHAKNQENDVNKWRQLDIEWQNAVIERNKVKNYEKT